MEADENIGAVGNKVEDGFAASSVAQQDKGKTIPPVDRDGDQDRQIVLAKQPEDDDEYVFEEDEEAVQMQPRWMAVARYYSGKTYLTWGLFNELNSVWGKEETIPVRKLGDKKFLVQFDSERLWKRVIGGGPW